MTDEKINLINRQMEVYEKWSALTRKQQQAALEKIRANGLSLDDEKTFLMSMCFMRLLSDKEYRDTMMHAVGEILYQELNRDKKKSIQK